MKDHLGSTRVVVDEARVVQAKYNNYAYGDELNSTVTTGTDYRFTGKELDEESGFNLYYYGARFYDARIGRFVSADPKAEKYAGWSPYAYTLDNPLKFNDPTGEAAYIVLPGNQSPQPTLKEVVQEFVENVKFSGQLMALGQTDLALGNLGAAVLEAASSLDPQGVTGLANPMVGFVKGGKIITQVEKATERGLRNQAKVLKEMGLEKNTQKLPGIDPKTGKEVKTIPDAIGKKGQPIEIKDRKYLGDSPQLRAQSYIAGQKGQKAKVITGKKTKVSETVERRMDVKRRKDIGPQE